MKFITKKIYIIIFLVFLVQPKILASSNKNFYTSENISNYFLGVISAKDDENTKAYKYLKRVQSLKNSHSKFTVEFVRNLVLVDKFDKAFSFSKSVWNEDEFFFEVDLLLGLDYLTRGDYKNSEKHFKRLNTISNYNLIFEDFIGNILIAWSKASQGKKEESFSYLAKIPKAYSHLKKIQEGFLKCYFDSQDTQIFFQQIIKNQDYNFSRYNFFLTNYLLFGEKNKEALKIIKTARKKYSSNLLLKQTENFLIKDKHDKIKSFFNCKNSNDSLAELFYVIANLYSSDQSYQLSNFYLKISNYLNKNFLTNKALLAENFYYKKKYKLSKNIYESLKSVGPIYSWYSSKSVAKILLKEKGKDYSIKYLEKEFNSISNPNFEHYYEMANFYKDSAYHEKSIEYYSLALEKINYNHSLVPKILDRRGTSYERSGNWKRAEKDLIESLQIQPDQAHVLNYLAYSWIDQGKNLDKGLKMLMQANEIKKDDGYIIDSLGWAYYRKKNYIEAEFWLQKAVQLIPTDPIISDHYGDTLWMLNKGIQARYIWLSILKLNPTEELRNKISKKLIFGTESKL